MISNADPISLLTQSGPPRSRSLHTYDMEDDSIQNDAALACAVCGTKGEPSLAIWMSPKGQQVWLCSVRCLLQVEATTEG